MRGASYAMGCEEASLFEGGGRLIEGGEIVSRAESSLINWLPLRGKMNGLAQHGKNSGICRNV